MAFMECPTCAWKPGSPILCDSCLHNRATIERLEREVAEKDAALDAAEKDLGSPWRFWAKKCREVIAQRKERSDG